MTERKIQQIAVLRDSDNCGDQVYALDTEGCVWVLWNGDSSQGSWTKLPSLPAMEAPHD